MSFINSIVNWFTPRRRPPVNQPNDYRPVPVVSTPVSPIGPVIPSAPQFEQVPRTNNKREKEASKYNGRSDLNDYLSHFRAVSYWNRWSYEDQGIQLAICLVEDAREILQGLDDIDRYDFDTLVENLQRRFSPLGQESQFSLELMDRKCKQNESVTEFGHALRRLACKAYDRRYVDEQLLVDLYVKGLPSQDMQRHVFLNKPRDLNEAINLAVTCEAFDKAGRRREEKRPVHVIAAENKVDINTQILQTLERMNEKLSVSSPPTQTVVNNTSQQGRKYRDISQVKCYKCEAYGHYASTCTSSLAKRKSTGRPCFLCSETGHFAAECPNRPAVASGRDQNSSDSGAQPGRSN